MDSADDLYSLRDQLMALDDGDRANLRALLERDEQKAPFKSTTQEDALWAALLRAAPATARHFRSLAEFLRDKRHGVVRDDYRDAVRALYDLIHEAKPVRHAAQDAAALTELLLDCLARDMKDRRRIEITAKTLVQNMPRLRVAVEDAYPGYAAAGMLHKLIRTKAVA